MILFFIIIIAEMLICAFRSNKKNTIRLICTAGSAIIAGGITFLCFALSKTTFTDIADVDLSLGGNVSPANAYKLDGILTAFIKGTAFSMLYVVFFWLLKGISWIVVKVVYKEETEKGFKPLGLAFGFVAGLICAGFTLMPYTGLQQLFPDKQSAASFSQTITDQVGSSQGKLVKTFSGPTAEKVSRYMGIGLITNKIFNSLTTAKTEAGRESLVEFAVPYLENMNDILPITEEDKELSEKVDIAVKALDVFSETKLLSEDEKLGMIEYAVKNNVPDIGMPNYKSLDSLSEDLGYAGNILKIFERIIPHTNGSDLFSSVDFASLKLSHDDITGLADNIYAMNEGGYFVNLILSKFLGNEQTRIDTHSDAFRSTKQSFIDILDAAMTLKDVITTQTIDDLDIDTLKEEFKSIRDSELLTPEDEKEIIDMIRENYDIEELKKIPALKDIDLDNITDFDDLPDSLFE
ncbi:MAG: hypothetical protein K6E62_08565 [Lachnospiraceae bacterium]|nr:hypothetical protein [Lachnospiraceae bacterium]